VPKPILILRTGDVAPPIAEVRGQYPQWIRDTAGEAWSGGWIEHDARTDAALPELESAEAIVITGSSHSVTERAPWMLRAEAYARDAIARNVPLFGICFGHQLVAQALGGEVKKNPLGREIGTVRVRHTGDDPIFRTLPEYFDANATHTDTVSRLPEGARLLAGSDLDATQAFAIGESTRCVQFHPEIDGDAMRRYVLARAHLIEAEGGNATAIHDRVTDAPQAAEILRNFVRHFVAKTV
jgi:GMP synthase (glutamine-hydrolysing)